jgi:hypothetical protein
VLSSGTPTASEEVLCVGNGWNRTASQTSWNVNWQESPPPIYRGFKQASGKTLRWGRNRVTGSGIDWGDTESFDTAFDETGGSVDEFQAVNGDSGGGCFAKRSGTWELVGIMWSRTIVPDPNDPGSDPPAQPLSTAAYTNLSIIADVAFYENEIQVNTPPPNEIPALPPLAYGALALLIGWTARAQLASGRSSS